MSKLLNLLIALTLAGCQTVTQGNGAQSFGGSSYRNDSQAFGALMACGMEGLAGFDRMYDKDPDFIAAISVLGKNIGAEMNGKKLTQIPARLSAVLDSVPNESRKQDLLKMVLVCNDFNASAFRNPALQKMLGISLSQRRLIANEIQSGKYTTKQAFEELMRIETLLTQELIGSLSQDELMKLMEGAMSSPALNQMLQNSNTKSLERRIKADYGIQL